ncbi:MAG: dockerin type I domain-containing protein [Oscillospiraceae bacterium]|nr:dockerin type I domain-containing protein [Oscillospiraceae bacterium]
MNIKRKTLAVLTALSLAVTTFTPIAAFAANEAGFVAEKTAEEPTAEETVYISEDGEETDETEYFEEEFEEEEEIEETAVELFDTAYVAASSEQTDDSIAYVYNDDGGNYYSDFDSIYTDISGGTITDGMTIKLLTDATWTLTANKTITIGLTFDLNGKTLTLDGNYYLRFYPDSSSSKVAFIDSSYESGDLNGKVVGSYGGKSNFGMIRVAKACSVELKNVYFENTNYDYVMEIGTSSGVLIDLDADNCEFVNSNTATYSSTSKTVYSRCMLLYGNKATATSEILKLKDCTFETSTEGNSGAALCIQSGKSATNSVIEIDDCDIINNGVSSTNAHALFLSSNFNNKLTVVNSNITAASGVNAISLNYSIASTADITFGEGNTVTGKVNFGNASSPVYNIKVTGGCFTYNDGTEEQNPFVGSSETGTAVTTLLTLTGGYFKTDVSDVVASNCDCVANTTGNYSDYGYTVAVNADATNFFVSTDEGKKYCDSLSSALASEYTGTVYFAADYTLTDADITAINTYGRTVSNYGDVALTYDGTLKELVSALTAGTIKVTTLSYKYDDTQHTIKNAIIIDGNLTSGTVSNMSYSKGDIYSYYTDDILTGNYVYYYSSSTSFCIIDKENTTYSLVAEVDGELYVNSLSYAVTAATSLNSYDSEVRTVTLLKNTSYSISINAANASFVLDLNGCTMSGYFYITYYDNSLGSSYANGANITVKNGTISKNSSSDFAIHTNGVLTGVTLTMENVNIENTKGIAIYLASGGTYSFVDCNVTGETGIVARSGDISITDTTITATGTAYEYDATYSGGAQSTGDALVLIASDYPGGAPSVTEFSGNTMTSENSNAVVCYTYTSVEEDGEDDIQNKEFITDGTYSSDVSAYIADNYYAYDESTGTYKVLASSSKVYESASTSSYSVTLTDLWDEVSSDSDFSYNENAEYRVVLSDIDTTDTAVSTAVSTIKADNTGSEFIETDISVKKYVNNVVDDSYTYTLTNAQTVQITLPVPADSATVYHLAGATPTTAISSTLSDDGYTVTFETSSFSPYVFVYTPRATITYADNVYLSLDDGDVKNDGVYNLVLNGVTSGNADAVIYRFMSAQLKLALDDSCDIKKINALSIAPADGINVIYNGNGEYGFYADATNANSSITAKTITLGTVTVSGVGTYEIDLSTENGFVNQAHGAETTNNIVTDFVYNANYSTGTGYLLLDGTFPTAGSVTLLTTELKVNVMFPNEVKNNEAAYTNMSVNIKGGVGIDETIKLGSDTTDVAYTTIDGYYGYTYTFTVPMNYTYALTFTGDGYRTCTTTITPSDTTSSVTVWNNVMSDDTTVVTGGTGTGDLKVTFLAGDIVMDNEINLYDLSAVVSYFGKTVTATEQEFICYDLNRDGKIDSKDIAMVLVSWDN